MQAQGIIMQHLQPAMCRAISSSATAAAAAPALVTSGGLGSIFGIGSRVSVPLSEALPGVVAPTKGAPPPAKVEAKTAKLPTSGVKVTAIDAASPVASFALTVAGGSAAPGAPAGAAKLLEALAFKSTSNRTTFRLTRELEKLGASGVAKASRESVTYSIEVPRVNAAEAVEILVDSVLNARFTFWETRDTLATVKDQLAAALKDPAVALSETLHAAAFDGGLAAPLFADPSLLSGLDSAAVKAFVTSTLHPSALSLAGASVDLSALTSYADPLIAASSAAAPAASSGAYVGGSLSVLAQASPLLHAAIAIEVAGGASSVKSAATAAVVKALLDNSRPVIPYRDVGATAFQPFSHVYTSTGLVGFSASAAPSKGAALVDEMVAKVRSLAAPVSADALARGKALATASFRASTATTAGLLAAADSIVTFPAAVAAVTAADVAAFVKAGLKKPTFVTYGSTFVRQDAVAKKLIA